MKEGQRTVRKRGELESGPNQYCYQKSVLLAQIGLAWIYSAAAPRIRAHLVADHYSDLLSMRQMWIIAVQAGWVKHSNNRLASYCIICLRSRLADVLSRRISFPQFVSRDLPSMHIRCYRGHEIIRGSSHAPIYYYIIGI